MSAKAPEPLSSDVTVCIPAYGPCPYLPTVIAALNAQTAPPASIVIGHSGEGDPSGRLESPTVPLAVLHSDERWCAGEARNRAAAQATTPWLAFMDADVHPAPDWLEQLLRAVPIYGDRGLIGGSIGYAETGGYWGMALWMSEFSSHHPYVPSARRHAIGSFTTLVRRELFDRVGGYPVKLYPAEDVAFAQLIREHGGDAVYHQGPLVAHYNISGFAHFARHARRLAESSATVRRQFDLPGSLAVRMPLLAFPMGLARFAMIYGRVLLYGAGFRARALALAPGVIVFLALFSFHFFRGARRSV